MSELKSVLFGEDAGTEDDGQISEIAGQVTLGGVYEPVFEEESDEAEEMLRDSMSAVERMKQEIAAETEQLDKRFAENPRTSYNTFNTYDNSTAHTASASGAAASTAANASTNAGTAAGIGASVLPRRPRPAAAASAKAKQPAAARRHKQTYVIGVLSAAGSLVFMGLMLLITLVSSPIGAYAALKASPVILIFLGAEILYAVFRNKSLRIHIDIRSVIVMAVMIILSFVLSVVSVNASAGTGERVYAEQRIQNMLASELHDTIAKDYIRSVDIETQLFGENAEMYETPADLTEGDIINLTINFADAQMTIREFAKQCREILDDIRKLPYNFGRIDFIADDSVNHYVLDVDWHYQSDYSADRLAGAVNYYGDDISDSDIPDLVDE